MSEDQKRALESNYTQQLYPGSTTTPGSMINVLTSENPSETIKAKIVTDPASVCVDIPSGCNPPWFNASGVVGSMPDLCIANLGETPAMDDLCADEGGETIYFASYDSTIAYRMAEQLSTGTFNCFVLV